MTEQSKLKPTVEVGATNLKRKHSSLEQPTSPVKIRSIRPVPSSPTKPLRSLPRPVEEVSEAHVTRADPLPSEVSAASSRTPALPSASTAQTSVVEPFSMTAADDGSPIRRTTRARRAVASGIDLFPKPIPPLPPRQRKPPTVRTEANLFLGFTPSAWMSMTKTNTAKNEAYQAAKLEIEVIRKEGTRPESPVMKVKTRSQKEQEERGQLRSQRAERRAQRSGASTPVEGEDGKSTPVQPSVEDDDDGWGADANGSPLRHRRGPGDEDDYVTPERPPPSKRARLGGEDIGVKESKGVKWDRGLSTSVYMDEIQLHDLRVKRDATAGKSCLAPAAKVS